MLLSCHQGSQFLYLGNSSEHQLLLWNWETALVPGIKVSVESSVDATLTLGKHQKQSYTTKDSSLKSKSIKSGSFITQGPPLTPDYCETCRELGTKLWLFLLPKVENESLVADNHCFKGGALSPSLFMIQQSHYWAQEEHSYQYKMNLT